MADVVDLAMDSTHYYEPPAEPKIDGRTKEGRAQRARQAGTPAAPQRRSPAASKRGPQAKDYRAGIEGLGQLAAGALLFVSPADGAAVAFHTPPIASALNDLAKEDPRIAAILDRILQVGPYGALLAAIAPLVLQILCNHGKLPAGTMGAIPPDQLVAAFIGGQQA